MHDLSRLPKFVPALKLAKAGCKIFPVKPNSKEPAIKGWQTEATSDPDKVGAWWRDNPDYNIGIHTIDRLVVDLDVKDGGPEAWRDIVETQELLGEEPPHTYTVRTPSGGLHLHFSLKPDTQVSNSVRKLGPGIDTRGKGGYVLGPGSSIDGKFYELISGKKKAMYAPDWLITRSAAPKTRTELSGVRLNEETPEAEAAAEEWIAAATRPPEGERNIVAYQVATRAFDFGIELATGHHLMGQWNEEVGLDADELETVVESAYKNRARPIGVDNPGVAPAGFEEADLGPGEEASIEKAPAIVRVRERKKLSKKDGWEPLGFFEAGARAYTHGNEPLVDGLLDQGTMSVLYGESNSGKSFVKMDMDYHIAMGLPWQGMPTTRGQALWLAAEGGNGNYKRVQGLIEHYRPETEPWFLILQRPLDLLHPDGDLDGVLSLIKKTEDKTGRAVSSITIDTLARVMAGGNENGSEDMGQLVHHFDLIREYSEQTHLCVIHHCGKTAAMGARGHSSLRAATDTEIEVTMAGDFGVKKQRDIETKWKFKFSLKRVDLPGVDRRGRAINTAIVMPRVVEANTEIEEKIKASGVSKATFYRRRKQP